MECLGRPVSPEKGSIAASSHLLYKASLCENIENLQTTETLSLAQGLKIQEMTRYLFHGKFYSLHTSAPSLG